MQYKAGQYLKNKELGTISIIQVDLFDVGKDLKENNSFQLQAIAPSSNGCWHGGYKFSTYWKVVSELDKGYDIINYKDTQMKITNLVKKILDKDTRTLVKAGFINGELALTDEGVSELLGLLFLEKKAELLKVAEEKIDEDSK